MGSGFRTFASGEVLTADNVQNYLMDQAVMVFAGTAERGSALPSPETGMTAYSTATGLQVYNGTAWVDVSTGYGVATGGASTATITVSGNNYTLLTFTSDSNLVVSKAGLFDFCLVGGGGGGGGQSLTRGSGGGGGGQVIGQTSLVTLYLAAATYTVDVGAGGAGGNQVSGVSGSPSEVEGLISACAGKGATSGALIPLATNGSSGGSYNSFVVGVTQGSVNVNSGGGSVDAAGGGGGGAAGTGGAGSGTTGGAGGNGLDISAFITGATYYAGAGGGGGAQTTGGAAGNGGVAGKTSGTGNNGVNYGAGGGGTYGAGTTGGNGAAGVVYVRFRQ